MNGQLLDLLFQEGVLDEQQFFDVQELKDYAFEFINIYFHDSEECLGKIRGMLELSDYKNLAFLAHHLKGSNLFMGAKRVIKPCVDLRYASEQNNRAGCLRALELLEHEYYYLKNRLQQVIQNPKSKASTTITTSKASTSRRI